MKSKRKAKKSHKGLQRQAPPIEQLAEECVVASNERNETSPPRQNSPALQPPCPVEILPSIFDENSLTQENVPVIEPPCPVEKSTFSCAEQAKEATVTKSTIQTVKVPPPRHNPPKGTQDTPKATAATLWEDPNLQGERVREPREFLSGTWLAFCGVKTGLDGYGGLFSTQVTNFIVTAVSFEQAQESIPGWLHTLGGENKSQEDDRIQIEDTPATIAHTPPSTEVEPTLDTLDTTPSKPSTAEKFHSRKQHKRKRQREREREMVKEFKMLQKKVPMSNNKTNAESVSHKPTAASPHSISKSSLGPFPKKFTAPNSTVTHREDFCPNKTQREEQPLDLSRYVAASRSSIQPVIGQTRHPKNIRQDRYRPTLPTHSPFCNCPSCWHYQFGGGNN